MIALRTMLPSPPLRGFVRIYAERGVTLLPGAVALVEPIPARLEQTVEFQFGTPFVVDHCKGHSFVTPGQAIIGAQTSGCSQISLGTGVLSLGVFFRPTGLSRLLNIPADEFTGREFDASAVFTLFTGLRERMLQCTTFEQRVQHVEEVFTPLAMASKRPNSIVEAAERIFSRRGAVRIGDVARQSGLGLRHFERRFLEHIGIGPKLYARVARFQSALDAKINSPGRTWLEIAHALRYHDQMHMVHDFQKLGGASPTQLLAHVGDARPVALTERKLA